MTDASAAKVRAAARAMILPLALAQFIASYAATNMNVARVWLFWSEGGQAARSRPGW